jgi:hypothetical protein
MPRNSDAINNPVNSPKKEIHTGDMHIEQRATIDMDAIESTLLRDGDSIVLAEAQTREEAARYQAQLAFNEEPIEVRIERSNEKNAPRWVPCWVNGRGAEVFDPVGKRWQILGALPLGVPCITRRKYIEVLALAKQDAVDTRPPTPSDILEGKNDVNEVDITTTAKYPFSVLKDNNPRGADWLNKLMYLRA